MSMHQGVTLERRSREGAEGDLVGGVEVTPGAVTPELATTKPKARLG